jgi:hypothetical protein
VGNVCIYCNGKGREFRTLDAVRKHMVDKSHCKIAYDTENDMLEMSDFYDFSASYPDAEERQRRKEERRAKKTKKADNDAAEGWEDVENDGSGVEVDEVIDEPSLLPLPPRPRTKTKTKTKTITKVVVTLQTLTQTVFPKTKSHTATPTSN